MHVATRPDKFLPPEDTKTQRDRGNREHDRPKSKAPPSARGACKPQVIRVLLETAPVRFRQSTALRGVSSRNQCMA